jgi:hypothetical protein
MKPRLLLYLALLTSIVLLLFAVAASAHTPQQACDAAYEKLKFRDDAYEEARAEYAALLDEDSELACAKTGLDLVKVFTLADLGFHSEAKAQLSEVTKEHPDSPVPKDLRYLNGGIIQPWRWITNYNESLWVPIGEILAVVAIAFLAWYAIRWRIAPWTRNFGTNPRQDRIDLNIQAFDDGATGLTLGKGLAAKIGRDIEDACLLVDGLEMGFIAAPIQLDVPADIQAATPQLKIISQLIEWALPQKYITVTGFLHKPGELGAGLTVVLAESWTGRTLAQGTLWQYHYEVAAPPPAEQDPGPYYRLSMWAGHWVCNRLFAYQNP